MWIGSSEGDACFSNVRFKSNLSCSTFDTWFYLIALKFNGLLAASVFGLGDGFSTQLSKIYNQEMEKKLTHNFFSSSRQRSRADCGKYHDVGLWNTNYVFSIWSSSWSD